MTATRARGSRSIVILFLLGAGCRGQPASTEQCAFLLDRIVEVEMAEQGFHDPALAARKKLEMRGRFGTELARCPGHPLRQRALACVGQATISEEISHKCLR